MALDGCSVFKGSSLIALSEDPIHVSKRLLLPVFWTLAPSGEVILASLHLLVFIDPQSMFSDLMTTKTSPLP